MSMFTLLHPYQQSYDMRYHSQVLSVKLIMFLISIIIFIIQRQSF